MDTLQDYVPIISLIVAALAVIVGPWVSWKVARRQSDITLQVASKQIVAPIRQAWVNSLRDQVAEILSTAHWYYVAGMADSSAPPDDEAALDRAQVEVDKKLLFLNRQVELMLNPNEDDHQRLLDRLTAVTSSALGYGKEWSSFPGKCEAATAACQIVLKREWERVKSEV